MFSRDRGGGAAKNSGVMASLARTERELVIERIRAGLESGPSPRTRGGRAGGSWEQFTQSVQEAKLAHRQGTRDFIRKRGMEIKVQITVGRRR
jgi:DNA invertase Pin-like site-specific DNA recombinase